MRQLSPISNADLIPPNSKEGSELVSTSNSQKDTSTIDEKYTSTSDHPKEDLLKDIIQALIPASENIQLPPADETGYIYVRLKKWQFEYLSSILDLLKLPKDNEKLNSLITLAFVHRSFGRTQEEKLQILATLKKSEDLSSSYERLEFLGDAVLGLLIARYLHNSHPEWSEGDLTQNKSIIVSRKACALFAKMTGIGEYILCDISTKKSNRMRGDICESILGAVFLTMGLDEAWRITGNIFIGSITNAVEHNKE